MFSPAPLRPVLTGYSPHWVLPVLLHLALTGSSSSGHCDPIRRDSNPNNQYKQGEGSGSFVPTCYICRKDGHYANQYPSKGKGKTPVVNMVMPEIQQVTIRSKSKPSE